MAINPLTSAINAKHTIANMYQIKYQFILLYGDMDWDFPPNVDYYMQTKDVIAVVPYAHKSVPFNPTLNTYLPFYYQDMPVIITSK